MLCNKTKPLIHYFRAYLSKPDRQGPKGFLLTHYLSSGRQTEEGLDESSNNALGQQVYEESDSLASQADENLLSPQIDEEIEKLLGEKNIGWWQLYVKGEVPDYPPRKQTYLYLTEKGVNVEAMEAYEIEDFTRWLLIRKRFGQRFPKFPYDITLEHKVKELAEKYPRD